MKANKTFLLKTLIAFVLVLSLCVATVPALANGPSPGITTYELDRRGLLEQNGARIDNNYLVFDAGGSMKFDLLLPFDSEEVVLRYTASSGGTVKIKIDGKEYTKNVNTSDMLISVATQRVEFGSHTVEITSYIPITLTHVTFQKIDESFNEMNGLETALSDYEYAVLNSVIFKNDMGVVKAKGAIRRLSYDNLALTPRNVDGRMYVPLNVIAPELDCYYEDYPDKSYILLRGEGIDLEMVAGKGYVRDDLAGDTAIEMNVFYSDGITWVPLRMLAEALNYYVEYREGFAVIDDRLSAKKVVTDEAVFTALCNEFSAYSLSNIKQGNTYHVSVNNSMASDANSGTEQYPFKTLAKAAQVAFAGDTVIIHEGVYRETLAPKNNGAAMAPITFCAAEGENVVISALEPLTNFVRYKNNIYCASVPVDLGDGRNQLFYKSDALTEGRHPNTSTKVEAGETQGYPVQLPDIWPVKGNISIKVNNVNNTRRNGFNVATSPTDLNQSQDYWKGGTYIGMKGEGWCMVSGDIVSSDYGRLVLAEHPVVKSYGLGIDTEYFRLAHKPDYGYITNHLNTVDMPGEWYMGNGVMYVYPPAGANLNSDFEVKQRQTTIDLRDKRYITIKNINTLGGGMTLMGDSAKGCVIDGGSHRWISHYTKMVNSGSLLSADEDDMTRDNTLSRGESGIAVGGSNQAVINTDINYSAAIGIGIFGRDHYIYNNNIGNTSYRGAYPGAIYIARYGYESPLAYYGNHVVRNNTLYNGGRALVTMGGNAVASMDNKFAPFVGNELSYNSISNGSITARDTGLVYQYGYTGGNDKRRTKIHHNYVYNLMNYDRIYDPYDANSNPDGIGTGSWHIYQDGYTCNQDTYLNLTFQSVDIGMGSDKGGTYEQVQPWTQVRQRDNSDLGGFFGGIDALRNEDFPRSKPFAAGSYHDGRERFMMNYNNLAAGYKAYTPDNSETVNSSWDFSAVNLRTSGFSLLSVDYVRDSDENKVFDAHVTLKDGNGEVVNEVTMPVSTVSGNSDGKLKTAAIVVPNEEAGVYDINLTFDDEYSKVLRLRAEEGYPEMENIVNPKVIYAGSYDDFIEGTSSGEIYPLVKSVKTDEESVKQGLYYMLHNTWTHTVIYKDRDIKDNADTLEIMYGTGAPYEGQSVKIYADSMQSEPIAEFSIENTLWVQAKKTINLKHTLTAGTHTIYVKFGNDNKCSDVAYFDFYNSASRTGGEVAA